MEFSHKYYVPCLPWKMGEYQALFRLSDITKDRIMPLIEVPEFGYDFDSRQYKKSVDENLSPFAKRVSTKWNGRPFFLDFSYINPSDRLSSGYHPVEFIFDDLRTKGCLGVPVAGFTRDREYMAAVKNVVSRDKHGLCLRVSLEESAKAEFKTNVQKVLHSMKISDNECDLIIDLKDPNYASIDGLSKVIQGILGKLITLAKWRNLVLLSTSIPKSMSELNKGVTIIPRLEWQLYKRLVEGMAKTKLRLPSFGDYSIFFPSATPLLDWRKISGAARIIYAIDDAWIVIKGGKARGNTTQYIPFCSQLAGSSHFYGDSYSWGDEYIKNCGDMVVKPGLPTDWIKAGANHHFEKVTRDLANLYAS